MIIQIDRSYSIVAQILHHSILQRNYGISRADLKVHNPITQQVVDSCLCIYFADYHVAQVIHNITTQRCDDTNHMLVSNIMMTRFPC